MKRSLVINAVLAAVVAGVISGLFFAPRARFYTLEVTLTSDTDARVQLFYDIGHGIRDEDSLIHLVRARVTSTCRFELPAGEYRSLRLDPLDRPGRATMSALTLQTPAGTALRRFPPGDLTPVNRTTVIPRPDGLADIVADDGDPILVLPLGTPLVLRPGWADVLSPNAARLGVFFLAAFALLCGAHALARRSGPALRRMSAWRENHPRAALAGLALFAAALACHPLILAGNSLVSPNFNVALLYEYAPAVPDVEDTRIEDVQGADIGALMWAHLPYTVIQHDALRLGELPLWNRYSSAGVPLLGQGQSMFGDPLHVPVVAVRSASWAVDLKFVFLRALFACGLGWTVLALRRDWIAAALVSFATPFVGFFIFRVNHPAIFSVCYAPWLLWAWVRCIQAPTVRATAAGAGVWFVANWCLLASGTVKEAYMLLASLNAAGLAAFVFTRDPVRLQLRKAVVLAVAGVALLLASMPLWLTFADALVQSHTFSDQPAAYRIPSRLLIGFFDDLFYRELDGSRRIFCPSGNLLLFAGVLWCFARLRLQLVDPLVRWLVVGGLVALGLAVDWIPSAWVLSIPGLRSVGHLHNTFSCVALVFFAVLAGCGFAAARETLALPARRLLGPVAVLCGVPAWLLWQYFGYKPEWWHTTPSVHGWIEKIPEHGFFYAALAASIAGLVVLHGTARRALRTGTVSWATGGTTAIVLLILLAPHGLQLPFDFRAEYFLVPPIRANLQARSPVLDRLRAETTREPFRVAGTGATLMPDFGAFHGLETFYGVDALWNRHYHALMIASGLGRNDDWMWGVDPEKLAAQRPFFDLLNVKFCVSPLPQLPPGTGYEPVAALDLSIFASPTTWPRAFFTDAVVPYRGVHEVVEIARASPGRPFAAVLESDLPRVGPRVTRQTGAKPGPVARASGYRLTPNSTSFVVEATGPGIIALHEAWMKEDFRVTVNGVATPYFRVNHAFKGIVVEKAGTYRVTFRYWPRHLTTALACSAAGFALLAAGAWFVRRQPDPA